jgi:hypothetical protein
VEITTLDGAPEHAVELHGETERLAADSPFTRRLVDATTLTVDQRIRIRITPGNGELGQRSKVAKQRTELDGLLASFGVADIESARAQYGRRSDLEQQYAVAKTAAEGALGGQDLDTVSGRIVELTLRTEQYHAGRGTHALPGDMVAADAAVAAANQNAKELNSEAGQARVVAKTLRDAAQDAHTEARVARQRAQDTAGRARLAEQRLVAARAQAADLSLEEQQRHHSEKAETATRVWRAAADTFDANALEDVQLRLVNERAVIERCQDDIQKCRIEIAGLDASLSNDRDARERLDEACEKLDAAEQTLESFNRRAKAARLLYDTLNAKRDAAKRAYVDPFRKKLEQYARIVYGEPHLELVVNDELAVTHRIIKGARVPYEGLSGGAQEQLALCSRLACAALVDPADGVPVVIDDALGFTDPDRLGRIGAVFSNAAGNRSQILILTCTPGRYQGIGRATVIPLQRSTAAALGTMDASGTASPAKPVEDDDRVLRVGLRSTADAAAAVLRALREADEPLGKSELVIRAGISFEQWPLAIRALLDAGEAEQRGEKRGTRYTAIRSADRNPEANAYVDGPHTNGDHHGMAAGPTSQ